MEAGGPGSARQGPRALGTHSGDLPQWLQLVAPPSPLLPGPDSGSLGKVPGRSSCSSEAIWGTYWADPQAPCSEPFPAAEGKVQAPRRKPG